jgi:hypothetical protein
MQWFAANVGQYLMLAVVIVAVLMFLYGAYQGMKR